jgi:hypothetical protein
MGRTRLVQSSKFRLLRPRDKLAQRSYASYAVQSSKKWKEKGEYLLSTSDLYRRCIATSLPTGR